VKNDPGPEIQDDYTGVGNILSCSKEEGIEFWKRKGSSDGRMVLGR